MDNPKTFYTFVADNQSVNLMSDEVRYKEFLADKKERLLLMTDDEPCHAMYVDKERNHYAANDDIIRCRLVNKYNLDARHMFATLIAYNLGLRADYARVFMTLAVDMDGTCPSQRRLSKECVVHYPLDFQTQWGAMTAIRKLIADNIILPGPNQTIKINPLFTVPKVINKADFVVIELNPAKTSGLVTF